MAKHSIIDPVDRIEGHLRVEMEVENGRVSKAWVSGGLFRGLELIQIGREPTDAAMIAQRICGVCPVSQGHTSIYAAEDAYGIKHPSGARLVRNLVEGAQFMHSHILWFYQLSALDYVNPLNALNADIEKTYEVAQQNNLATADFGAIQERLQTFASNGQYSWLSGGWFMDGQAPDAYKLSPELDLIATAHYIEAIDMQATADEIAALIGGKMPHIMSSIPGGTTFVPNYEKLDDIIFRVTELQNWVTNTMIPDAIAIAKVYKNDLVKIGNNTHGNFMAYGVFDADTYERKDRYFPSGIVRIKNGSLSLEDFDIEKITEETTHAYYADSGEALHPTKGVTVAPDTFPGYYKNEQTEEVNDKYTWSKAPRYDGQPMEVGPLARVLVAYMTETDSDKSNSSSISNVKSIVASVLKGLDLPVDDSSLAALNSALGRLAARPIEAAVVTDCMLTWLGELMLLMEENKGQNLWFTDRVRDTGTGQGAWEAPRGALYHTMSIEGNHIKHYQAIVPSTWNISPRDAKDVAGTIEQALVGCPVDNLEAPINALRIVHGYDPCIACAVHLVEPKSGKEFRVEMSPWGGR